MVTRPERLEEQAQPSNDLFAKVSLSLVCPFDGHLHSPSNSLNHFGRPSVAALEAFFGYLKPLVTDLVEVAEVAIWVESQRVLK